MLRHPPDLSHSSYAYCRAIPPQSALPLPTAELGAKPHRPPLLIKVTGYRLLCTAIWVAFGTAKVVKSLEGGKVVVTWLDGVFVVVLGVMYARPFRRVNPRMKHRLGFDSDKVILVRPL